MNLQNLKKEARDIITDAIMDGQNQIHDLRSERATPDEITKRMENTFKYCSDRLDTLIDHIHAATVEECIGVMPEDEKMPPQPLVDLAWQMRDVNRMDADDLRILLSKTDNHKRNMFIVAARNAYRTEAISRLQALITEPGL